jgi:hypothetical protein
MSERARCALARVRLRRDYRIDFYMRYSIACVLLFVSLDNFKAFRIGFKRTTQNL